MANDIIVVPNRQDQILHWCPIMNSFGSQYRLWRGKSAHSINARVENLR